MADKTKILILGGGFGGLYAALHLDKTLAKDPGCEVTLVNETNFALFTPMLHEVAASDVDPSDIVNPIRKMLRRTTFYEAGVRDIDLHARKVTIAFGLGRTRELAYDHLLIALGSETKFFDEPTRLNAMQMKTLSDAVFLRNQMIGVYEAASVEPDEAARRRLLTFVVAGGGFAGVETIGAMNDLLRDVLRYYPQLDESMLRVILAHPGDTLLPEFTASLGRYTADRLRDAKIDVRLHTKVGTYDGQTVRLEPKDGPAEEVPAATLVWTAGVTPVPIIETLPVKREKKRIVTNPCMEVEGFLNVWAVGDVASIPNVDDGNKPYPTTAQHAMREGKRVAQNIVAAVRGRREKVKPFRYKMIGQLAAIGQRRGTAQIFGLTFSGFFAWWLWRTVYLAKLPRIEKRLRVTLNWTLDLFFSKDTVQIITLREVERITRIGMTRYHLCEPPAPGHDGRPEHQAAPGVQAQQSRDGDGRTNPDHHLAGSLASRV